MQTPCKRRYERLIYLVRVNPTWLASLLSRASHEKAALVQLIVFVLYADMHDHEDDKLLLQLFGSALATETRACADIGEYMRSNTPLTDCLSKYNQREPGKDALHAMLKKPSAPLACHVQPLLVMCNRGLRLRGPLPAAPRATLAPWPAGRSAFWTLLPLAVSDLQALGSDLNLELEPLKVYEEQQEDADADAEVARVTTNEEAAALPEVAALVGQRVARAMAEAQKLLDAITSQDAVDALPFGMRWIAKVILQLTRRRWPEASDDQVYPLVGGFIFLRWINPIVVTPESIGLLSVAPGKQMRRNFVLLGKMLLALSNNVLFGQLGKEKHLAPLNGFITSNRQRLRRYFDALVDVQDVSMRELQIEKYMSALHAQAASRYVHMSLNEIYFLHRLLIKHKDVLVHPAAREELAALSAPPEAKLPKEEDEELTLRMTAEAALDWEELKDDDRTGSSLTGSSGSIRTGRAASMRRASVEGGEDDGASQPAANARQLLRSLLHAVEMPEVPIPCSSWEECHASLRQLAKASGKPAAELADSLARETAELRLTGDRAWTLVIAARDELLAAPIVASQLVKYTKSRDKMQLAARSLKENITIYETTLEQIRGATKCKSAAQAGGKPGTPSSSKEGAPAAEEDPSYKFTFEKLHKRGLFVKLPKLPDLSEKKAAKLLHKARRLRRRRHESARERRVLTSLARPGSRSRHTP